ncbi:MAG: VCBS repeat-containing protein [Verrucomicrobiales bacterium]|nr:VCBS repeat-containing protein [Verrucomicrobiales bacterium]
MATCWLFRPLLPTCLTLVALAGAPSGATEANTRRPPQVVWSEHPGYRTAPLTTLAESPHPAPRYFSEVPASTLGILWTNQISPARYGSRQNTMNGAGLALADFDGDGWCDLFLCGKEGPSALYRNLGNWQFEEVTAHAGVACPGIIATGAAVGDVNGDGRPDLHVTSFLGPDALFLNLGGLRFSNVTAASGLETTGGNTSSAFSDVDGDGDLDLYLCRFGVDSILRDGARITTRLVGGVPVPTGRFARRLRVVDGRLVELGESDVLFLNDGQGRFHAADWSTTFADAEGTPLSDAPLDFSLAVQIRDFNDDGHPDLYICSDFQTPDRLWLGQGGGRFRAAPRPALRALSHASMGVDAADLDRDGRLDFMTVEMLSPDPIRTLMQSPSVAYPGIAPATEAAEVPRNVLQWNRGDGTYAEIAWFAGVAASDWSWTPIFVDVDLDGFQDLLVSNGHPHDLNDRDSAAPATQASVPGESPLLRYPALTPPKVAWRNTGSLQFENVSESWGFHSTRITHGMALADLDNDGDPDVVGNVWRDSPLLLRNDAPQPRIAVRLAGHPNRGSGVGAKVQLRGGPVPVQELELLAGGRYLSADQPQLTFAAPSPHTTNASLHVRWRHGGVTTVPNVRAGMLYEIAEPDSPTRCEPEAPTASLTHAPWFEPLPLPPPLPRHHTPHEEPALQPLMPWNIYRAAPQLAASRDADALWVHTLTGTGSNTGAPLNTLRFPTRATTPSPTLAPLPMPAAAAALTAHLARLAAGSLVGATPSVFATVSVTRPQDLESTPSALRWDRQGDQWNPGPALPSIGASAGPLVLGDTDLDGDLDVVIAGRCLPGRYPEPAPIVVFTNHQGQLTPDTVRSAPLTQVGLVTGLALADFDQDQTADLAVACEWGALRLFRLNPGPAQEDPRSEALREWTGLWQCLSVADFDGDGRLDLAAGNWGQNSAFQRTPHGPWQLWFGEFTEPGRLSLIETVLLPGETQPRPRRPRDVLQTDLPWLRSDFPTHRAFAHATLDSLLRDRREKARSLEARTLASTVFLNRATGWERHELPPQAQWSPIHDLSATDLDLDGDVDLVAAQNLFACRPDEERLDAGCGLLLRNDGRGNFTPIDTPRAGLRLTGEQRAILAADLDADGRPDLVTAESNGPFQFWRRTGADVSLIPRPRP